MSYLKKREAIGVVITKKMHDYSNKRRLYEKTKWGGDGWHPLVSRTDEDIILDDLLLAADILRKLEMVFVDHIHTKYAPIHTLGLVIIASCF